MSQLAELFVDIIARDKTGETFRRINDESKKMVAGMSAIGREALAARQITSGMSVAGVVAAHPFGALSDAARRGGSSAVSAMMQQMTSSAHVHSAMIAGMGAPSRSKREDLESLEQARAMNRSVALREELALIQEIVNKRRLSLDAAGTPQGLALAGQMNRMDELAAWRQSIIQQGRIAGNMHEISQRLAPLRNLAAWTAAAGGGLIAGLGAAASPQIWDTLTGSIRILAASIGRGLLPTLIDLSRWVQNIATWFRNLSEPTQVLIGRVIFWGTALATTITTFGLFSHAVYLAIVGIRNLATTLGLIGAAQVGGTAAGSAAGGAAAGGAAAGGSAITMASMAAAAYAAIDSIPGLWRIATADDAYLQASIDPSLGASIGRWLATNLFGAQLHPSAIAPVPLTDQEQQENPLLSNFRFQPRLGGIEDVWRNVQMASLGQTPQEQLMLRLHLEAMEVWNTIAANTAPQSAIGAAAQLMAAAGAAAGG